LWIFVSRICFVCRNHNPVLHSWFFTGFVTRVPRWAPLVEQELLTLKKLMSSPLVFVRFMLLNLVYCVAFCGSLFVLFLLVIITASEYSFGISKLFLLASHCIYVCIGCYFTLKNNRNLHLKTASLFEGFILLPTSMLLLLNSILFLMIYLHIF
jgi:hypothetical protein